MNLKTHKKGLIALALVFFMIVPMLMAVNPVHGAVVAQGSFSVVQDSSTSYTHYSPSPTSITSVTVGPSPNPIGTALAFDVMLTGAAYVAGWSLPTVTWNPAVLTLVTVKEGPFLTDSGGSTLMLVGAVGSGLIGGGISDAISSSSTLQSPDSSGVCCTLFFTIAGYGSSSINIIGTGSNQAYLHTYSVSTDTPIPVAATDASVTVQAPPLSISLVPHGLTSGNLITEPSSTSPIGDTFQVDAYLQGAVNNIFGWSLDVTWNPAVLAMTGATEGTYLSGNPAATSATTLFVVGSIDNTLGQINGGINDAYNQLTTSTAGAGVLCTFAFQVVGFGSSTIAITPGATVGTPATPAALLTPTIPPQAISCTLNNLNYVWTAPTPTNPTAAITVTGSPFGPGSVNTFTGYGITLSSATSTPGIDEEPPNTPCPITGYSWSVTLVGGQVVTATTPTLALTNAQIGQTAGTITATLTVTAPVPTGALQSPGYNPTSAPTTLSILVETPTPGGVLDIWTQNGGQGPNVDSSSFGPQQMVYLYAYVSYNGAPVVNKTVTFEVSGKQGVVYVTAPTDQSGLAVAQYRLPWQDSNPAAYFGEMSVYGTVDVAQVTLTDQCNFYYGYQLKLNSVTITDGNTNGGTTPPVFNRYGSGGTTLTTNEGNIVQAIVSVTNTMWNSQQFWLSAVIYDNNSVPVAQFLSEETIGAGTPITGNTNTWQNTNTQPYQITLTIPTWAFVGPATLYVNIFSSSDPTGNTLQNPLAWSPQVSAPLSISANYFNNVIVPSTTQPQQVLNVQYTVNNDEDSGFVGYWALDSYVKTVQVWSLGGGNYEVVATYKGTFTTYNGALSPMNGVPEVAGVNGATGTIVGEYIATFTSSTFNANPSNPQVSGATMSNYGIIGVFNDGGTKADVLKGVYGSGSTAQTGDINPFNALSSFFPGYQSFTYVNWGWTYNYGNTVLPNGQPDFNHIWINSSAGSSGDIVVQAP